jgi:hypothetical protein
MALFVLGAGATRGCSFVKPGENPCLPFLDRDFFTQLQRVGNQKHQKLVRDVMRDIVDLFGTNFDVTMETVFTTLEQTTRMVEAVRENKGYTKVDLLRKKERLKQAIAVILEEALMEHDKRGRSKLVPKHCDNYEKFVKDVLSSRDEIVSFNYDCVIDYALKSYGSGKWNAHHGYGFNLGSRGSLLKGDQYWSPVSPATKKATIHLYKLHGSLHFDIPDVEAIGPAVKLKERPYTKQNGVLRFTIIPPEWHKRYDKGVFATIWNRAARAVSSAEEMIFIGYSMPLTDLHSTTLFRTFVSKGSLKTLVVVNPDQDARRRVRAVLQRGISPETRILSFDYLHEFLAMKRTVWHQVDTEVLNETQEVDAVKVEPAIAV